MDHTELPWEWNWKTNGLEADCGIRHIDNSGNAHAVVRCPRYQGEQQWKADAAFIVRACNDYYNLFEALNACYQEIDELTKQNAKLLEALKAYVSKFGDCGDTYEHARQAIAEAEGQS